MNEKIKFSNDVEVKFCEILIVFFFFNFFLSLLIIKFGVMLNLSFKNVSYLTLSTISIFSSIYIYKNKNFVIINRKISILGAFITGLIAILINRYTGDDGWYLSKAVYYTEYPETNLDYTITWIANLTSDARAYHHFTYETLQSIFAWFFGFKLLFISHIIYPFFIGILSFLSIYLVVSLFEDDRLNRFFASIFFIFLILLLSETSRNYGVYSIGRIHQGKSVVLFLGFFTWLYFSLKFFEKKNLFNFFKLLFIGFTLSEISTTGIVFIPILSSVVFLSYQFYNQSLYSLNIIKDGFAYLIALIPIIFNGLLFKFEFSQDIQNNLVNKFSSNYMDQLSFFIGDFPLTIILFFISIFFLLYFKKNRINKFFLFWIFVSFIFYLNPLTSPFIMKYLTSNLIYWRLFYILPFPFVFVLIFLFFFNFIEKKKRTNSFFIIFGILLLLLKYSPTSIINQPGGAKIRIPSYKLTPVAELVLKRFSDNFPPGTMVSDPKIYSVPFTIYNTNYKQFFLEPIMLKSLSQDDLWHKEVSIREKSMKFLYRDKTDKPYIKSFKVFLKKNCPDYILQDIDARKQNIEQVKKILINFGYFIENSIFKNYSLHPDIIVWKSPCRDWKKDFHK